MAPLLRPSRVLKRLREGKYVLFFSPTPYSSPKIVEMAGLIGFDGVWIDMEHQDYSYDQVFNMCLACRATGMDAMVRIRKGGDYSIYRGYEVGAQGIMVPHVKTGEEARWVVRNARFHPQGLRGMDGIEPTAGYGLGPTMEYVDHASRETFVVCQIEDVEALDNIDDIASTPGLDVLFLGAQDLSQSLGIPCQFDHPKLLEARKKVADAAVKHGKWWGTPASPALAKELYETCGARFFAFGAAILILQEGFRKIRDEFTDRLGE
jgi:4-hydroxy-2-oxoheptanedioate aldolase